MSNLKRWARTYYHLSPIFNDNLFNKPGNEKLVAINPRLFAAYCIKMNKDKIYTEQKIKEVISNYFNVQNYWTNYIQKMISTTQLHEIKRQVNENENENEEADAIKQTFQLLLSKLYRQQITGQQFQQLFVCFEFLSGRRQIIDLDYLVLDLSFTIDQILQISQSFSEAALSSIGKNSLERIQLQVMKQTHPNIFQYINLLTRIKDITTLSSELANLCSMFEGNQNAAGLFQRTRKQSGICIRKQASGFMIWLIHANEFGHFVAKFVKNNHLFNQYSQKNVQTIINILCAIEISPITKLSELVQLSQITYSLQNMQEKSLFFKDIKQNVQIQVKLKKIKEKLQQRLSKFEQASTKPDEWVNQIDKYQIDFNSSITIKVLKKLINKLIENAHFTIILPNNYYEKLLRLCIKIDEIDLYHKVKTKIDKNKNIVINQRSSLLILMERIYCKQSINQQANIKIYSIYELKRIKNLYIKMGKNIDQLTKNLQDKDKQLVKKAFQMLNKSSTQLSNNEISKQLQKIFENFKL